MDNLFHFLSIIRWQDVVDITLNSYILFRLYALFRGTNVFRILIAIAFLWFSQRIAVSLGLIVTSWAFQGITAAAALIIIVVFRNEIRSVLQAKNLGAILWGLSRHRKDTPLDVIADSVFEMARRRIGALIVIPGKEDLKEVVHSGIFWHGIVSKEMLMSIFWHENPVHDGAAIIQEDRVTEVGVILPLSDRKDLPPRYGTRHRAALGLAEETDALVIVVSEERGNVTLAQGSDLHVTRSKEELSETLRNHIGGSEKYLGYLRKEKVELGVAALVSILFVAGIWLSFTRGLETLATLEVPIEYTNRDPTMEILDASVNSIRLDLSGSGALIRSLGPGQVKVRLDLSKGMVGRNTYTIDPEEITLPPGVILRDVKPSVVEVTLDVPVKKELPIQVDWVGKLPEHLIIEEVRLDPERVQVMGGSRILESIATIYTEKIPLDKIEGSGSVTVKLALNPASLKIAPGSKDKVKVEYVAVNRQP